MKTEISPFPHDGSYVSARAHRDGTIDRLRRVVATLRTRIQVLKLAVTCTCCALVVLVSITQPRATANVVLILALVVLVVGGAMYACFRGDDDIGVQ
ncbi:MAG: hypothetical protein KF791_08500 [Verrucomicrobiae bacterium]|nr:hypothetical protein [Verrucomicrobiae bacterium]